MLKKIILCGLIVTTINAVAQPESNPGWKELQEKVIPWSNMMAASGNAKGKSTTVQGRTFTAYQIGLIDTFTNWIKKSYIPIGGLPQPERLALPDGVERRPYVPKGTGVSMGMWAPCYDATGKKIIQAQPASATRITILTNHIKGVEEAYDYNTPSEYYFTMYYDLKGKLVNNEDEQKTAVYVNEIKSKIGDFFVYFTGNRVNVLIMQGKELPLVQITRGEVLDKGEEAIRRGFQNKLVTQLDTKSIDNIRKLREKYKNSLQEPAFVNISQLTRYSFSADYDDIFQPRINDRYMYPVYKIKPAIYELCEKDKPQWVSISFPYATEKSSTVEWEIFKAMTKNFNYRYVYDYFFNPDKVKGKSYQPLNIVSQAAAEEKNNIKQNNTAKAKNFPQGIHFMEDFADATSGTMPAGWTSTQNNRGFTIETPKGETGKWLLLDNQANIIPSSIKKPLPENFTFEFDLLTTDFTNRAGRTITLSLDDGKNAYLYLLLTPGNNENLYIYPSMGIIKLNAAGKSGYHNIEFSSYSNKKTKAHIRIVKLGTSIKAFVNGTQIKSDPKYNQDYDKEMQLPANTAFANLKWQADTVSPGEDRGNVYISNIKITKD